MQQQPPSFDWVTWTPEDIVAQADKVLGVAAEAVLAIAQQDAAAATFASTFAALDTVLAPVHTLEGQLELLAGVSPLAEVRTVANEQLARTQKVILDMLDSQPLYQMLSELDTTTENLSVAEAKLRHDTLQGFKLQGLHLDEQTQAEVKRLSQAIIDLETQFSENITKGRQTVTMTEADLVGLPEWFIAKLPRTETGEYIVSTDYPDYHPFMAQAVSGEARRRLYNAFNQRAAENNAVVLPKLIQLRDQRAKLLGYAYHGDYQAVTRMARSSEKIFAFLGNINTRLTELANKDRAMLETYKHNEMGDPSPLTSYDVAYISTQLRKKNFSIDPDKLAEYFPLEHVFAQMLEIYSTIFSLTFVVDTVVPVWHESVVAYRCLDANEALLGYIYTDMFPREEKFGHAAVFPVARRYEADNVVHLPVCALVTNFTTPSTERPSLLRFSEVQTLFHEFGHALHNVCSTSRFMSQSGTVVARDFVEAPSQALEFWLDDNTVLDKVSAHYQTKDVLPAETRTALVASEYFLYPLTIKQQLFYGLLDMHAHTTDVGTPIVELAQRLKKEITQIPDTPESKIAFAFGHLAGYDAGYYGYLWSEVFAADIASVFRAEGFLNPETGRKFRHEILAVGSSRPEHDSLVSFLGREPNSDAFFAQFSL
jgi:thimet oligopeptidase